MKRPLHPARSHQAGTVLLVALIMLLVMSLLGLNSLRGTSLEERMAGNWRDQNLALQAAEAALRAGESVIAPGVTLPEFDAFPCAVGQTCTVFQFDEVNPSANFLTSRTAAQVNQWIDSSTAYVAAIEGVREQPRFIVEHRLYIRDSLVTGTGTANETGRHVYIVTARGVGQTPETVRVLQTQYAKRYN